MKNKITFDKPGNFLYPVSAVMVSCRSGAGENNIITIAWTGTVCSEPPMLSISVRKERHSYPMIRETGEFVVNLTDASLLHACDYCGCVSGAKVDKFKECGLTAVRGSAVEAPLIVEAPVNIECKVTKEMDLGSHVMFLAEVKCVHVDEKYLDEKGAFHMENVDLIAYSHGKYHGLGEILGTFGYSVRRKK